MKRTQLNFAWLDTQMLSKQSRATVDDDELSRNSHRRSIRSCVYILLSLAKPLRATDHSIITMSSAGLQLSEAEVREIIKEVDLQYSGGRKGEKFPYVSLLELELVSHFLTSLHRFSPVSDPYSHYIYNSPSTP